MPYYHVDNVKYSLATASVRTYASGDLGEQPRQDKTRRTVDLGHPSDGQSWINLIENRVNTTESRFSACLNRLLQQNRQLADMSGRADDVRFNPGKADVKVDRLSVQTPSRSALPYATRRDSYGESGELHCWEC
jgi:hypothetical protein